MSLFKSLYSDIVKPVVRPIGQGLELYERYVNAPLAFSAKLATEHPNILWSGRALEERLREKGITPRSGTNLLDFVLHAGSDKRTAAAVQRDLGTLPLYARLPLELATDPLTYATLGYGAIAKGAAKGGLKGAIAAASREAFYQTGVPQVGALIKAPYTTYRAGRLGKLRQMLSVHEAVKDISHLTESSEEIKRSESVLRAAIEQERNLGFFARRRVGTAQKVSRAWKALGAVMEKSMDQQLLRADIYNNNRWRFGFADKLKRSIEHLNLVEQLVLPSDELKAAIKTDTLHSLGALQRGVAKMPKPLRSIWSALDPSVQQIMLENPTVFNSWIFRNKFVERGEGVDAAMGAIMSQWQRKVGLRTEISTIGDVGATPVLKKSLPLKAGLPDKIAQGIKFDAKGRPVFEDVMRWGPEAFEMTPEQTLFWHASHKFLQERIADYKKYLLEIPEFKRELKKNKELAASFAAMGQSSPDGSLYWPRVALYEAELGVVTPEFKPSRLRPALERIPVLSAYADMPVPAGFKRVREVRTRLGAQQAFEHWRELERPEYAQRFIWSGDVGHTLYMRSREMAVSAADETILPALRAIGKTPSDLVSVDLISEADRLKARLNLQGKVSNTLQGIWRARGTSQRTSKALRDLTSAASRTGNGDVEDLLASLGPLVDEHNQLTDALPKEAMAAARLLGRFGGTKATEDILRLSSRLRQRGESTRVAVEEVIKARDALRENVDSLRQQVNALPEDVRKAIRKIGEGGSRGAIQQLVTRNPEAREAVDAFLLTRENLRTTARAFEQQLRRLPKEAKAAARELLAAGSERRREEAFMRAVQARLQGVETEGVVQDYLESRRAIANKVSEISGQIKGLMTETRNQLKEVRAAIRDAQKNGQTFAGLHRTKIPALSNYLYPEKLAKELDKLFMFEAGAGETAVRAAAAVQVPAQTFLTGGDLSFIFLQAMAAVTNPGGFARSLSIGVRQMFDRDTYLNYIRGLGQAVNPRSGRTVLEEATRANVRLVGTELYHATEALSAMGVQSGRLHTVGEFLNRLPWNVGYAAGRNVAALEMFRVQTALEGYLLGRALTDDELRGVGRQVNLATGAVSMKELGIAPGQAAFERAFGRLGVQWFRSQTGRLVQAFNVGQIEGRVARRLLFQQLSAMTALYVGTAHLFDQVPQLDPTKPHFGQLRVGDTWVGFGGIYPSMMRAVFKTGDAVAKGDWDRFKDIKEGRNPVLNFWHGGAPIIGRFIADAVFGVNEDTRYGNLMQHPEEAIVPISIQSAVEGLGGTISPKEAILQGVFSGAGLSTNPITAVEYFQDVSNRIAKERGYVDWESVPKAIQEDIRRAEPELQAAKDARDKYYEARGQTPEDRAFEQRQQNLNAIQDIMVGLWDRVQRGEMTKSEWRQRMAELWQQHSVVMDILFNELPDKKKSEPTVLQDRLAVAYQAVRPEQFDANKDGVIEEAEWAQWRAARRQWWQEHPEAQEYESYIKYEYPVRLFDDPVMRQAEVERRQMQDLYDEFLDIPKYRGLSADDAQAIDALRGLRTSVRQELRLLLAKRGVPEDKITIPSKVLWRLTIEVALREGIRITPALAKIAILMDKDEVRAKARNLDRVRFLLRNPDLLDWYPQSRTDAGLTDIDAARLGLLNEPVGTPVSERLTTLKEAVA